MLSVKEKTEELVGIIRKMSKSAIDNRSCYPANFAVMDDTGFVKKYSQNPCHSAIGYPDIKSKPFLVATEFGIDRRVQLTSTPRETLLPLYEFVRNDPMWGEFITHIDESCVVISADAPQNVLHSLMITSRMFWEASIEVHELFGKLLNDGMHERVAFLCAYHTEYSGRLYTRVTNNSTSVKMSHVLTYKTGHRPFGLMAMEGIQKYVDGKGNFTQPYKDYRTTSNVQNMFGNVSTYLSKYFALDLLLDSKFKEDLRIRRLGGKEDVYTPPNPFATPKSGSVLKADDFTYEEYLNFVLPYLVEKFPRIEKEVNSEAA